MDRELPRGLIVLQLLVFGFWFLCREGAFLSFCVEWDKPNSLGTLV